MRANRTRRSLAITAVLVTLCGSAVAAQPATPAPYPSAPDPAECIVSPRSAAEVAALVATSVSLRAAGPATPFAVPEGTPADDATAREVTGTLHQVFACANAGDPLRFASLYTDEFLRSFFGGVPASDLEAFLALPPRPLPAEQQRVIREIGEVTILPDGRAGVMMVLDEPDDPRTEEPDYVILERVDGRWLVDEVHENGGMAEATPVP